MPVEPVIDETPEEEFNDGLGLDPLDDEYLDDEYEIGYDDDFIPNEDPMLKD